LADALARQAGHNGGAWWFDSEERERLATDSGFAAAYLPPSPTVPRGRSGAGITAAVADQYRAWPYPAWTRIDAPDPTTLPAAIEAVDPGGAPLPRAARVLVAGCGTGREAAILARRFPDARITAIDVSETSLAYAAERCAGLGIDFRQLDLHAAPLGPSPELAEAPAVL
ncbi:MAG TPA: class I SAM-dependent methyltransferase, partial [Allosphingosinicella sp.]|nr:class I SAM-dependent methyltransferase [Allosphingosinicella sp.]